MSSTAEGKADLLARPDEHNSAFFQCDIQKVFSSVIHNFPQLVATAKFLNTASSTLSIPLLVTEQQPFTTEEKRTPTELLPSHGTVFEKKKFSMCTDEVLQWLKGHANVRHVFIYGIETSLDLLRLGYSVHLVVDGAYSQRGTDREVAIERMKQAGVITTTAESALYEILKGADHAKFKACLPAVKEFGAFHRTQQ